MRIEVKNEINKTANQFHDLPLPRSSKAGFGPRSFYYRVVLPASCLL
jgi:hypothetical protein